MPMKNHNVIIFGYDELLLSSVNILKSAGATIAAVIFPSNRNHPGIKAIREQINAAGLPTLTQPPRKNIAPFVEQLKKLRPDIAFTWSYSMILPESVLNIPKTGGINLHMGLLPEYRGANGLQWAIINGEKEMGVTLHFMDAGIDTGPVIARAQYPIQPDDDLIVVMKNAKRVGESLLRNCWPRIADGAAPREVQDESKAGYYAALRDEDRRIDWGWPVDRICNLVRAMPAPFPGAYTELQGKKLIVRKVSPMRHQAGDAAPGDVLKTDENGICVAAGDGAVIVEQISNLCL